MAWKLSDNIIYTDEDNIIRIYVAQNNEFKSLNQTGSIIWRMIVDNYDQESIIQHTGQLYGANKKEEWELIRRDVTAFINDLSETGIIGWC